jgi:hypothetical protein
MILKVAPDTNTNPYFGVSDEMTCGWNTIREFSPPTGISRYAQLPNKFQYLVFMDQRLNTGCSIFYLGVP